VTRGAGFVNFVESKRSVHLSNGNHEFLASAAVDIFAESFVFFLYLLESCEFGLLLSEEEFINHDAVYSSMLNDVKELLPTQQQVDEVIAT
jgi:hypothetical protein